MASSDDDYDICTEIPTRKRRNYRPLFPDESVLGKRSHSERFVAPRDGELLHISRSLNELPQSLSLQQSDGWATGLSTHTYIQVRSPESGAPEQYVVTYDMRAAVRDRPAAVAPRQSHVRPYSSIPPNIPAQRNENETSSLEPSKNDVSSLTQSMLQMACKRAGVSCSGSKAVLVTRLNKRGFTNVQSVRKLAEEYEANPARIQFQGDFLNSGICSRDREPNWNKNEYARPCHVICDPRNATALTALYNRPESRAELDQGRHDPWSNEFPEMFNDPQFRPDVPEISGGAIQEEIDQLDPAFHKHKRTGALLKRGPILRSKFSIAYTKWTSSGQGDFDNFPNFTEGDTSLVYCFCVFHGKPALEYAVRLLPTGAQAEQGVPGMDAKHDRYPWLPYGSTHQVRPHQLLASRTPHYISRTLYPVLSESCRRLKTNFYIQGARRYGRDSGEINGT
jgi:hypothetical protein